MIGPAYGLLVEDTVQRLRAEAERERLLRQLPARPSAWRARLARACYWLAERLDERRLEAAPASRWSAAHIALPR